MKTRLMSKTSSKSYESSDIGYDNLSISTEKTNLEPNNISSINNSLEISNLTPPDSTKTTKTKKIQVLKKRKQKTILRSTAYTYKSKETIISENATFKFNSRKRNNIHHIGD